MSAGKALSDSDRKDKYIQIWRGIAALVVIYYHFSNRVPPEYLGMDHSPTVVFHSGKLGVLIFFIISGYLITLSLTHSRNLAWFYAKRISRIWPLFILASISIFLFLQFFDPPIVPDDPKKFFTQDRTWVDLLGSIVFLEDLGFRWMDGVFWSILVELKYYFWIGLLAFFRPATFVRDFAVLAISFSALEMAVGFFGSRELAILGTGLNGFFIAQYLPFFAIGALLLTGENRSLLCILLILALFQAGIKSAANPDFNMLDSAVFGLALAGLVFADRLLFQSRIFLHLGDHSYSFYLFHQILGLSIIKALGGLLHYDIALIAALVVISTIAVAASWAAEWRFRDRFFSGLMRIFVLLHMDRLELGGGQLTEKQTAA